MPKKLIPDRWDKYKPFGKPVGGTKFLPFKTPLTKYPPDRKKGKFTPSSLIANQPHLRAVINLTNTSRYYDPTEFMKRSVSYKHIKVVGRELPSKETVSRFFEIVDGLMERFKNDKNALIGVHCTHGLNRTGYFICKYMVERMKINPQQAIRDFQYARGHNIERKNYINDILGITEDDQQNEEIEDTKNSTKTIQTKRPPNNMGNKTTINVEYNHKKKRLSFGHDWHRIRSMNNQESTINERTEHENNQQNTRNPNWERVDNQQDQRIGHKEHKYNQQDRKKRHFNDGNYPPQGGNYPPQGVNYPPPGGNYPPPGVNYPPPGGNYPPPGVNYPPPGVNYPPPGVNYPPPGVNYPPPGGNYPPQYGNYPPPGVNYPPQWGNCPPQWGYYPPQGGNYPPQGGNYPPRGKNYPPQGGNYPPQSGNGPPQGRNNFRKEYRNNQQDRNNWHSNNGNYPPQGGNYPSQGRYNGGIRDGDNLQKRHRTFKDDEMIENQNNWNGPRNSKRMKMNNESSHDTFSPFKKIRNFE